MRILYAEDNQANIFFMRRVAKVGHHEIVNFIDGDSVLKKFNQINPDLVLMDIQLSGERTGLDVVRELRRRGIETPIIAVTAYAMVGDEERCLAAGCDAYLAKPLPVDRLVELFRQFDPANQSAKKPTPPPHTGKRSDTETVARMIINSAVADAKKILAQREAQAAATPDEQKDAAKTTEASTLSNDEAASDAHTSNQQREGTIKGASIDTEAHKATMPNATDEESPSKPISDEMTP